MSAGPTPFSKKVYRLKSCLLHTLSRKNAPAIASALAKMDPWKKMGYPAKALEKHLLVSDEGLKRFRVECAGKTAGIICVRYPWLRGSYLDLLGIFAHYQGQGRGRELIEWMAEQTSPVYKNIWALVSSFNTSAREFYQKQGFIETGPLHDLVKPGYDEILIRKIIP
jgi:diamine N-acetyltransferase